MKILSDCGKEFSSAEECQHYEFLMRNYETLFENCEENYYGALHVHSVEELTGFLRRNSVWTKEMMGW